MNKSNDEPKVEYTLPGEVTFSWDDGYSTHYYYNPAIKVLENKPEYKQMYNTAVQSHIMWMKHGPG